MGTSSIIKFTQKNKKATTTLDIEVVKKGRELFKKLERRHKPNEFFKHVSLTFSV